MPRHVAQHREVAGPVLRVPEGRPDDDPRRVVDAAHEGELRTPALEPVVPRAVDLDEHPRLGHPLSPAPVPRRPAMPGRGKAGVTEQPAQRGPGDRDPLVGGQQLCEVAVVDPLVPAAGEVEDPRPVRLAEAAGGRPALVAVDEPVGTPAEQGPTQPPGAALAEAEQPDGLVGHQVPGDPAGQHVDPLLVSYRQRQPLSHRGRLTKSLSSCGCHIH